jgi:hypothetical protein
MSPAELKMSLFIPIHPRVKKEGRKKERERKKDKKETHSAGIKREKERKTRKRHI